VTDETIGRADLHMHTNLGDGWISPARLVQTAMLRRLAVIAVTDHDHVEGARRVEDLLAAAGSPVRMITGVEVSTRSGHLLGLFAARRPGRCGRCRKASTPSRSRAAWWSRSASSCPA